MRLTSTNDVRATKNNIGKGKKHLPQLHPCLQALITSLFTGFNYILIYRLQLHPYLQASITSLFTGFITSLFTGFN